MSINFQLSKFPFFNNSEALNDKDSDGFTITSPLDLINLSFVTIMSICIALRALWSFWLYSIKSYREHYNLQKLYIFIDSLAHNHKSDILSPTPLHVPGLEPYQENIEAFDELFKALQTQNTWPLNAITRKRDRVPLICIDACNGLGKTAFMHQIAYLVRQFQLDNSAASFFLKHPNDNGTLVQTFKWLHSTLVVSISYDDKCSLQR